VVQPENRGTTLAVLYALFRIAQSTQRPGGLPSVDHFISIDQVFYGHVNQASRMPSRTDLVTLWYSADSAELGYADRAGGPAGMDCHPSISWRVRHFWKAHGGQARSSRPRGGSGTASSWWVARPTMLELIKQAVPSVYEALPGSTRLGTLGDTEAIERLYCGLPSVDCRQWISPGAVLSAVLPT